MDDWVSIFANQALVLGPLCPGLWPNRQNLPAWSKVEHIMARPPRYQGRRAALSDPRVVRQPVPSDGAAIASLISQMGAFGPPLGRGVIERCILCRSLCRGARLREDLGASHACRALAPHCATVVGARRAGDILAALGLGRSWAGGAAVSWPGAFHTSRRGAALL